MLPSFVLELHNLVDGHIKAPTITDFDEAMTFSHTKDAASGTTLTPLLATDPATVDVALATAHAVHVSKAWTALLAGPEREAIFERLAAALEARAENIRIAEMVDVGDRTAISGYGPMVLRNPDVLRDKSLKDEAEFVDMWSSLPNATGAIKAVPIGPVVVLAPTNAPLGSSLIQILSAIFYGCPVIVKPSPFAPHSFNVFAEAILAASLPQGLIQIVHGGAAVARRLISSPFTKGVCFTGSTSVGLQIAELCAPRLTPFVLELGGVNPFIVLPGADVALAVEGLLRTFLCVNGQYCCGATSVLVHASLRNTFVDQFLGAARKITIGDPRDEKNAMGALNMCISTTLHRAVAALLDAPGVTLLAPDTELPKNGFYAVPSLIEGVPDDVQVELFGPMALLRTFQTTDEAIALANAAPARLKTYVFGSDADRVAEGVDCGWFDVNQSEFENVASFDFSPLSGFGHADARFFTRRVLRN
ncbi:aldehyde dehydrogenase [Achlya hypogyna]|uniref:Aldehyde dehydrogenase n=1 Tax=Achlya hypogyna TaxID=1202772 RepID=A0A1V9ZE37_ACHHY|nr:aldehyde dehydrogenase [Achlya hypogyna]